MTGPEPTMDELIELGAKALCEHQTGEWDLISPFPDHAMTVECREYARAILTAVLPRVLEGAQEALAYWEEREPADDENDCSCEGCTARRRARSVHSHIEYLIKGGT